MTVALVCAASQGLGKAAARALAADGAAVAICSRRGDAIEAAARELRQETGADVAPFVADLSRAPDPARVVQQTVDRFGGLDILVTNTGGPRSAPFEARIIQQIPMGRLGDPADLAHVIAFLASAGGDYVTGTTIPVDGGYLRGVL